KVEWINAQMEELACIQQQALIGRPFTQLFKGIDEDLEQFVVRGQPKLQHLINQYRERLTELCKYSPIATLLVNGQAEIKQANLALESLTGYSHEQLLGLKVEQLLPPELRELHLKQVASFFSNPEPREMGNERRLPMCTVEGEVVEVEIGLLPLQVEGQTWVMVFLHQPEDVERWNLFKLSSFGRAFEDEGDSERLFYYLQGGEGEEIETQLSVSILFEQKDGHHQMDGAVLIVHDMRDFIAAESAKLANRSKNEFLAIMSHELRTPLSTIIGNSQLLGNKESDPEKRHALTSIELAGRSQLAMINDILDLSRVESGKIVVEQLPYDLDELLEVVVVGYRSAAHEQGLQFHFVKELELGHKLMGDMQRVRQILNNLLSNALKFTQQGSVSVRVWGDALEIHVSIEDTGIGMSVETLSRLFRRFEQADQSISRGYSGAGVGLYISRELARLMDGEIEVSSEVEKGTIFQLNLPCRCSEERTVSRSDQAGTAVAQPETEVVQFRGKVLVVEDTPEMRMLVEKILSNMGVEVSTANNGQEAVEIALSSSFDLILMDMQMPVMNGIEATRMLRLTSYSKPIVALTANVTQQHREDFEQAGGDDFLTKPIELTVLIQCLGRYLQRLERGDVAEHSAEEPTVSDELSQIFLKRLYSMEITLKTALQDQAWSEIRSVAHNLKGSGTSFGHPELTRRGKEICELIDHNNFTPLPELVGALCGEIDSAVESSIEKRYQMK
ncbi:MAG: response regulator, partial [Gammaproteobacteria bacterium]|nr:response regulator [Gammaproteobacteria bacterium]MBT4299830.1 response regulator [Gammaproteobacteria bacterium]MBT5372716.1 response regulator [Gammaproteobacteria bacterium]MBT6652362.1 response regulator [Gammaproteobacteria bacterium]MBT7329258.1 response regulator [Gammaproteobacteria bacterium]